MKIEDSISISELSEKCQELLHENSELKEEIRALKARLVIAEARYLGGEIPGKESEFEIIAPQTPEVSPQPDLFMLIGIKEELEERLPRPVDIVNKHWASHLPGKNPGNSHLYQTTFT